MACFVSVTNRPKSIAFHEAICQVIPGGVNSPVRAFGSVGVPPIIFAAGAGDTLIDIDGNRYIDLCCAWGSLLHGHAHPTVLRAVFARAQLGTSFGATCPAEKALAEAIVQRVPSVDKVRFVNSGTEATMSVARLARGYAGRPFIVKFVGHYHGHADFFLVRAGSGVTQITPTSTSAGIPSSILEHTISLPFNDSEAVRALFADEGLAERIAAVIVEPIAGNMGVVPPADGFLQLLRAETQRVGALLIFDEVITGFRVGTQGAQGLYGVTPDLSCFSKIMGGGFPVGAFGGRAEIMDLLAPLGPVYQAGTLSGNPVAMEAGLQALLLADGPDFYQRLEARTRALIEPAIDLIERRNLNASIQCVGSLFTPFFGRRSVMNGEEAKACDTETYARFFAFMLERGVYLPPAPFEACFISSVHTDEHLNQVGEAMFDFFASIH